jgi:cold shock protein
MLLHSHMATGTVVFFSSQKGFGFVKPDDGGPNVFVHISAVKRAGRHGLRAGQKVSFEVNKDSMTGKLSVHQLKWL